MRSLHGWPVAWTPQTSPIGLIFGPSSSHRWVFTFQWLFPTSESGCAVGCIGVLRRRILFPGRAYWERPRCRASGAVLPAAEISIRLNGLWSVLCPLLALLLLVPLVCLVLPRAHAFSVFFRPSPLLLFGVVELIYSFISAPILSLVRVRCLESLRSRSVIELCILLIAFDYWARVCWLLLVLPRLVLLHAPSRSSVVRPLFALFWCS